MVTYDVICAKDGCEHVVLEVGFSNGKPIDPIEHCGLPMDIWWNSVDFGTSEFQSFTTRNIHPDGKPGIRGSSLRRPQP